MQLEPGQTVEEFYCEESSCSHPDNWVSTYLILEINMIKEIIKVLCLGETEEDVGTGPGDICEFPFSVFTEPPETYWTSDGKRI